MYFLGNIWGNWDSPRNTHTFRSIVEKHGAAHPMAVLSEALESFCKCHTVMSTIICALRGGKTKGGTMKANLGIGNYPVSVGGPGTLPVTLE